MKKININYIPQNIAPIGAKKLALFNSKNEQVAEFSLRNLASKSLGEKLYSFGALSDIHLPYATQNASTDFQEALAYFNNVANVDFICISGDMSDGGTDAEWLDYKNHVDAYSPNIPVHLSAGNHDVANGDMLYDYPVQYTGNPLWYSFEQNNDVFIMFGLRQWQGDNVFHNEALQWLYETLEDNKDKRCFVFQHEMRLDGCGNAHGLYGWDGLAGRNGQVFLSLMEHYKNVIWFHGHSHTPFKLQSVQPTPIANYDRLHGCHSVHIPSLAIPRYGNSDVIFDAEGYVVDVYENGIHLRGIDFIEKEFVPIASYWIDTTPIEIPVNSYVDTKGVVKKKAISLPEGSELIMNQRYSYSSKGLVTDTNTPYMFTAIMPVMPNTGYVLRIKNSNIEIPSANNSNIYGLDSSKISAQYINGGSIPSMTTGITFSEDKKSADITFTTADNVSYIALSLKATISSSGTLKESDIVNYIIELEQSENNNDQPEIVMPEGTEVKADTQFSESGGGFREMSGYRTYVIPVEPETAYKFNIANIPSANLDTEAATIYELTADQVFNSRINGSKYIYSMTDTIISEDCTSAEVNFVTTSNARYIAVSIILGSANPDDIKITLETSNGSISLPEGSELYLNQRYSYSEAQFMDENGMFAVFIPVDEYAGKSSIIRIKNSSMPLNVKAENGNNSVIYALKSDKTNLSHINGAVISDMSSDYITYSADYKSADIYANIPSDCGYLAISLRVVNSLTTIYDNDIKDYIIEIDVQSPEVPEEVLNHTNLVPTSVDVDGTIYNSVGYKNNTYITTSGNIPIDTSYELVTTGLIENPENHILYVYGATFNTTNSYCRVAAYNESKECTNVWSGNGTTSINVIDMGNGIQKIELVSSTLNSYPYVRFSFEGVGDNLYVYNIADETIVDEIILEQGDITNSVTWTMDKRLSSAGDPDKDLEGAMVSDHILVNPGDIINIYGITSLNAKALFINLYKDETFVTNIPLSNAGVNPTNNNYAYAEYIAATTHLTIQIKDGAPINSIRVCCVTSTVTVYRNAEMEFKPIVLPEGSELYINQRFSQSGGGLEDTQGHFAVIIPIDEIKEYTLSISNIPNEYLILNSTTLYRLDESKACLGEVNGSACLYNMTEGVIFDSGYRSAVVKFTPTIDTNYMVFSCPINNETITEENLENIVITLEEGIILPEGSELYLNQRFSQSGQGLQDSQGHFAVFIPVDGTKEYTLSISNMPNGYLNATSTTLYKLDETKTVGTQFNGANFPCQMTTGVTMSEDYKSAVINIPAGDATVHYLAFTFPVDTSLQITENHLVGIVITLEESN